MQCPSNCSFVEIRLQIKHDHTLSNIENLIDEVKHTNTSTTFCLAQERLPLPPCAPCMGAREIGFTSLTNIHLHYPEVSSKFLAKLVDFHPSQSPIATFLQRLHIVSLSFIGHGALVSCGISHS